MPDAMQLFFFVIEDEAVRISLDGRRARVFNGDGPHAFFCS